MSFNVEKRKATSLPYLKYAITNSYRIKKVIECKDKKFESTKNVNAGDLEEEKENQAALINAMRKIAVGPQVKFQIILIYRQSLVKTHIKKNFK